MCFHDASNVLEDKSLGCFFSKIDLRSDLSTVIYVY